MLGELFVTFALLALLTTVITVLNTSLKWAQEIEQKVGEERRRKGRFTGRCGCCGADFLSSPCLTDGRCSDCQRPLCSHCAARSATFWLCPYCSRQRYDKELYNSSNGLRRPSVSSIFQSIMNVKDDTSSSDSLSKWSGDSMFNSTSSYSSLSRGKTMLPTLDSDISNGWGSDYESDTGRSVSAESWEGNWVFKKKLPTDEHLKPLAMFVPTLTKIPKAKIGGVEVDDLSEFSDYSDSEIEDILK